MDKKNLGMDKKLMSKKIKDIIILLEKNMKYTKCSNCGAFIPNGTRAYIGIDSARGDVFCSKHCVVRYITSGEMVYVDSETDCELNWYETKNNNQYNCEK